MTKKEALEGLDKVMTNYYDHQYSKPHTQILLLVIVVQMLASLLPNENKKHETL